MKNVPRILLFDLGGVLIDNVTFQELDNLLPAAIDRADLQEKWLASSSVRAFEKGTITAEIFAASFVSEWGLALPPEQFLTAFAGWPKGPFEGVTSLLACLRRRYTIGYLSNSNPIHWQRLSDVIALADHAYSSHELGLLKPDSAIFERVISDLGVPAGDICFFDDSFGNVEAARTVGIEAHQTIGFTALKQVLRSRAIYPIGS